MQRYACVHGHFYQPPRENPWLEEVELQDSAYPYHDWNERISAECYAANSASRILDAEGRIDRIVNNYSRISFNFGPTLLSWLEERDPETYSAVLAADAESRDHFGGHGAALAQVYNHMILPLSNPRDKRTQIAWGMADFTHRFGRVPEGMWLAETAADIETLDALAEAGVRFTILAPNQARRVRRPGARNWRDVSGSRIDPSQAYQVSLPSGRTIAVFFYDGPISRAVAFEGLLNDGRRFADRILGAFSDDRPWAQLAHIATDGESYGHHHRQGDMALAYALDQIEREASVSLTVYGEYLERHPPTFRAEIHDRSSWSCVHGVDRWWRHCGCNSGGNASWRQDWRTPLRDALDWLRRDLGSRYEERIRDFVRDPWAARDAYISLILDRSAESRARFFTDQAQRPLDETEQTTALMLLEMQRHLMLMYTSCGWFFDEISGIETVQVIRYAGHAIQLASLATGYDAEHGFLSRLAEAKSNIPEHRDGAAIYEKWVKPSVVSLTKVAAHYAISSLFETFRETDRIFCYEIQRRHAHRVEAGRARLLVGRGRFASRITGESSELSYGVLHFGDHNIQAGVREFRGDAAYEELTRDASESFLRGEIPEVLRLLDRHFDGVTFSVKSLFRDEQRRVLEQILESTIADAETSLRQIYESHAPLMRFLGDVGTPPPRALQVAAEYVFNGALRRALASREPDPDRIEELLLAARREAVPLDEAGLRLAVGDALEGQLVDVQRAAIDFARLDRIVRLCRIARNVPFEVDLWRAQNLFYDLSRRKLVEARRRGDETGERLRAWVAAVGDLLSVGPPED